VLQSFKKKLMKKILFIILLFPLVMFSQTEKYPVYDACKDKEAAFIKECFYSETKKMFFEEFKTPTIVEKESFKGNINAVFVVTNTGDFKLIYVNSPYKELKIEVQRVFDTFTKITPASFNSHSIEMLFTLPISFPLGSLDGIEIENRNPKEDLAVIVAKNKIADSTFLEHNSQLNIPFTHQRYIDYDFAMHKANGTHTASKPYLYSEVGEYYDLTAEKKKFLKPEMDSWLGKKLWNEHLLQIKHKDYWLTMDFLVDVQIGKDNSDVSYTFNNTRLLNFNGGLGGKFSFSATVYESQGRFANYVNNYISNPALNVRPLFSEGLVPGRGKAKGFKDDAFDYPVAEGYLSYTPSKYMQFQFGQGKNFIGDGYRSFVLSDVSSPSTYLKMKVDFWKFQYTNTWMWGTEPSLRSTSNPNQHARKYIASHYLSINLTEKFNLGFFETAISAGEQGFDAGFLNPLIFYRSVEFNRGEDAGNALVGLTAKYKWNENIALYSQLIIDEFSVGNLGDLSDWRNKFAFQLGAKYFNAFEVDNLYLQLEYNGARPYTFAHQTPILNYGNYSQPLGHAWGSNFWEAIAIARYKKDRWTGSAKIIYGKKGFDYADQTVSYGGDIYQSYNIRLGDTNNELAQGNTATIFNVDVQGNYLLNPSNNLSLFAGLTYRSFSPELNTNGFLKEDTIWLSVGIKADLFNWYLDF
jgi:hypothetical protein